MTQLDMEFKYSKQMTDNIVFDSIIDDCGDLLNTFRNSIGNLNLDEIDDVEFAAVELLTITMQLLGSVPIQSTAVKLGLRLGQNNYENAVVLGTKVLAACMGESYSLVQTTRRVNITPKVRVDDETIIKLRKLTLLPPNLRPARWLPSVEQYAKMSKRLIYLKQKLARIRHEQGIQ